MLKRIIVAVIGGLLCANGIMVAIMTGWNIGWALEGLIGGICLIYAIWWKRLTRIRWLNVTALTLAALMFCSMTFLLIYGNVRTAGDDEAAVIVLGAGLRGETVTLVLAERLVAVAKYHAEVNPDSLIVVSGGQGVNEDISEAEAMSRWLLRRKFSEELIIKEDKSTSTYENLTFSKALLDERLPEGYSVAVVTNDFHVFRADMIARQCGFRRISHVGGHTEFYLLVPYLMRELPAICSEVFYEIFGLTRK